jgi:hypothetical protein
LLPLLVPLPCIPEIGAFMYCAAEATLHVTYVAVCQLLLLLPLTQLESYALMALHDERVQADADTALV